jgi:hypothetical protein
MSSRWTHLAQIALGATDQPFAMNRLVDLESPPAFNLRKSRTQEPVSAAMRLEVPKNWLAADFDHGLGFEVRFLTWARAWTTHQNTCFHRFPSCSSQGQPSCIKLLPAVWIKPSMPV